MYNVHRNNIISNCTSFKFTGYIMLKLQQISELSEEQIQDLIKSVDTVLFDIDGVLVHNRAILHGSDDAVAKLRKLGKNIGFITNNGVYPVESIRQNLTPFGATVKEIVTPNMSLLAYLKKIDFKKDIYVISCSHPKKLLREAGYNVIEYEDIHSSKLEETIGALANLVDKTLEKCKNVGMVYLDFDFNLQHGALQVAKWILVHIHNVQLLSGMSDDKGPMEQNKHFIGPQYYIDALERWTNKKAIPMAKPGLAMTNCLKDIFNISDRSRVLMVGDNVLTDIAFGIQSNFKTCLVLSGLWKEDQVTNWTVSEDLKPDYVASSLKEIFEKIRNM